MRPATGAEIRHWDELIAHNPDGGHILHTRTWADFKSRWNWKPEFFVHEDEGAREAPRAVLFFRRHIAGLGSLWYAPKGPSVSSFGALEEVLGDGRDFRGGFLVKVEPELLQETVPNGMLATSTLRRAASDVQIYGATIIVDLRPPEDALLASFKAKTRYNIKVAARRGVTVYHAPVTSKTSAAMYRLMAVTSARAGFPLRQRAYFMEYWAAQAEADQGELFFAMLGDEVLSGVFVQHFGKRAWYKDGGSTKRHSALMAPYLLQWEVMKWLRSRGVRSYDLVAVPRRTELHEGHPLWGLYRFKSGFNEHITEYVGTLDMPLPETRYDVKYDAWNLVGERAAAFYSSRVRNNLLY